MKLLNLVTSCFAATSLAQVTFQNSSDTILRVDNGTYGPAIEEVQYAMTTHILQRYRR